MTTPLQVRTFAYTGSEGDTFGIDLPSGFGAALGQQSYKLRKETGKNIRIRRNRTDTGYAYGYTAYIKPKEIEMVNIADKLTKVNESFTINMYDNGYMVEVGGRDDENDWKTSKIICATLEEVIAIVREVDAMPRND
jgi:hypothetical protein